MGEEILDGWTSLLHLLKELASGRTGIVSIISLHDLSQAGLCSLWDGDLLSINLLEGVTFIHLLWDGVIFLTLVLMQFLFSLLGARGLLLLSIDFYDVLVEGDGSSVEETLLRVTVLMALQVDLDGRVGSTH